MITVTVPATSANVGAGFDSLGLALSMHNVFTFEECDRIRISSVDGTHVPTGANNLVYRSARAVYDQLGIPLRGLRITQRNDIPMARGLGSSSACIVAAVLSPTIEFEVSGSDSSSGFVFFNLGFLSALLKISSIFGFARYFCAVCSIRS